LIAAALVAVADLMWSERMGLQIAWRNRPLLCSCVYGFLLGLTCVCAGNAVFIGLLKWSPR
jgi:hypothetical protein